MNKNEEKRRALVQHLGAYIIANGLTGIGIRELAKAAETSDRMLIYYFGTRDALIDAILMDIADAMESQLNELLGEHKRSANLLLEELTALGQTAEFMPTIRLWFELLGLAARDLEPYRSNASKIARNWLGWIESKLEKRQALQAPELFATLEGRFLMLMLGVSRNG